MPMFWDAYLADTTHLTTEEHGAYLLLLAAMWRRNGSVPDDDRDLARIVGLTQAKWRRTKDRLSPFLTINDGLISQKNLQKIWKITQEKIEVNRKNGAKGGLAKHNKTNDIGLANGSNSLKRNPTIPEPEPDIEKEEPIGSSKKSAPKRGTSLKDDWQPNERNMADAIKAGISEAEIENVASAFRDYHAAKGTVFKDWDAGWRTWLRNRRRFDGGKVVSGSFAGKGQRVVSLASIAARNRYQDEF